MPIILQGTDGTTCTNFQAWLDVATCPALQAAVPNVTRLALLNGWNDIPNNMIRSSDVGCALSV